MPNNERVPSTRPGNGSSEIDGTSGRYLDELRGTRDKDDTEQKSCEARGGAAMSGRVKREPTHVLVVEIPIHTEDQRRSELWQSMVRAVIAASAAAYDDVVCGDPMLTVREETPRDSTRKVGDD